MVRWLSTHSATRAARPQSPQPPSWMLPHYGCGAPLFDMRLREEAVVTAGPLPRGCLQRLVAQHLVKQSTKSATGGLSGS